MMNSTVDTWAIQLTADVDKFNNNLNMAIAQMSEVNHYTQTLQSSIENTFNHTYNVTNITQTFASAANSMNSFGSVLSDIGKVLATQFAAEALVDFSKSCIELGSDLTEVQNVVDTTFPHMSQQVEDFAHNAITAFGMSETSAKNYLGTMGSMLKSMGLTENVAEGMSESMVGLAGDLASFYNLDIDESFRKIRSGISGETEPLKQLGINMSVANLEAYALSEGITKSYNAMSQSEQAMLRYNYLMSVTADAQGDFARTSDGWANQVRILTENFNSLKATIGQGLVEAFTPVITIVNELLSKLNVLTQELFKLFGIAQNSEDATGKATGAIGDSAMLDANSAEATAQTAEKHADNAQRKANKATKAVKAAQATVASFDDLNKMQDATVEADYSYNDYTSDVSVPDVSDVSDLSDYMGDFALNTAKANKELSNTPEWLQNILDWINKVQDAGRVVKDLFMEGFSQGSGGDLSERWNSIIDNANMIKDALVEIWSDKDVTAARDKYIKEIIKAFGTITGAFASIGTTVAENFIGGVTKYITNNTARIKKHILKMFEVKAEVAQQISGIATTIADIFSVFGDENAQTITGNLLGTFAEQFMSIEELATQFVSDLLGVLFQPIQDNIDAIKENLDGFLGIVAEGTTAIREANEGVFAALSEAYDTYIAPIMESFKEEISVIIGIVMDLFNKYVLPMLESVSVKFQAFMSALQETFGKVFEMIGKRLEIFATFWKDVLVPLASWVVEKVFPIITQLSGLITGQMIDALTWVIEVIGDIADVASGLIDFIAGVFTGDWEKAWNGVSEIFDGFGSIIMDTIDWILGSIQDLWSFLTDNAVVNAVKSAWDWLFGGGNKDINISMNANGQQIQTRANGGFVNSGDIFIANENAAPEMIGRIGNHTAVANQNQIVDAVSAGVADAMMQVMTATQSTNNQTSEIVITLDGEEVGRGVQTAMRRADRRNNVTVQYA